MRCSAPPQYVPPGHFYSPVPGQIDIDRAVKASSLKPSLPGIDLHVEEQLELLNRLAQYYPQIPFPEEKHSDCRFAFNNPSYSWCDAIILYCMLREMRPSKIIEVGSGYTSALILDTNEKDLGSRIQCTFIEPYPELLRSLLKPGDVDKALIVESKLQDVEVGMFRELEARDILFIDSSHVAKAGSDVVTLFSEILPLLNAGTLVHFHDVFANFEYPEAWLREGRGWNEQYILRAFLQFNVAFRIKLFTPYLISRKTEWFREHMPNCFRNTGGHIWIERVA